MSKNLSRARIAAVVAVVALLAGSLVVAALPAAAVAASTSTVSRTAYDVAGYCSSPSGFATNRDGTVDTLRLSVSPASPRAGAKVTVKVFVKQTQRTLGAQAYPAGFLRGQVVIGFSSKHHVLNGRINAKPIRGVIFPTGWTAKATFRAPKAGRRHLVVNRIVYNVRGGANGGWTTSYAGFDLVCSGGPNPTSTVTNYAAPRLVIPVRK